MCFSIEYGMVRHKNGNNVPFVDDIAIVFAYISKHYNKGISNSFCIQYSENGLIFNEYIYNIVNRCISFLQGSNTFIRYTGVSPPFILFVFMNNLFSRRFWMLHFMLHTHPFSRKEIDFIIIFFYYIKKWHFCVISSEMKIELLSVEDYGCNSIPWTCMQDNAWSIGLVSVNVKMRQWRWI